MVDGFESAARAISPINPLQPFVKLVKPASVQFGLLPVGL